jgi:hypothetical protein
MRPYLRTASFERQVVYRNVPTCAGEDYASGSMRAALLGASRNAAICDSQGHRPWKTFEPQRGVLKSAPLGLEQRCGIGATRYPRGDAPGYCRLGLWPTRQCCHLHNPERLGALRTKSVRRSSARSLPSQNTRAGRTCYRSPPCAGCGLRRVARIRADRRGRGTGPSPFATRGERSRPA